MLISSDPEDLSRSAPAWALALPGADVLRWSVAPGGTGGDHIPPVIVDVETEGGFLTVREAPVNPRLPEACPELHINRDGTFCIGRRAFRSNQRDDQAKFWQGLGEFLINVDFAERRGFWPHGRWLSHGPRAADQQALAEAEAERLGLAAEYACWLEDQSGPLQSLFEYGPRVAVNVQNHEPHCPLGCVDKLRRPRSITGCRHRRGLTTLLAAEQSRARAQLEYYAALKAEGDQCCGRMPQCPLPPKES